MTTLNFDNRYFTSKLQRIPYLQMMDEPADCALKEMLGNVKLTSDIFTKIQRITNDTNNNTKKHMDTCRKRNLFLRDERRSEEN